MWIASWKAQCFLHPADQIITDCMLEPFHLCIDLIPGDSEDRRDVRFEDSMAPDGLDREFSTGGGETNSSIRLVFDPTLIAESTGHPCCGRMRDPDPICQFPGGDPLLGSPGQFPQRSQIVFLGLARQGTSCRVRTDFKAILHHRWLSGLTTGGDGATTGASDGASSSKVTHRER
jgi:hypothetical protein